jgi:hypothetical protein
VLHQEGRCVRHTALCALFVVCVLVVCCCSARCLFIVCSSSVHCLLAICWMYVASLLFVSVVSIVSLVLDCWLSVACRLPVCGLYGSSVLLVLILLTMICCVCVRIICVSILIFNREPLLQAILFSVESIFMDAHMYKYQLTYFEIIAPDSMISDSGFHNPSIDHAGMQMGIQMDAHLALQKEFLRLVEFEIVIPQKTSGVLSRCFNDVPPHCLIGAAASSRCS